MLNTPVCGLILAAGAGTRYGSPKALARMPDGTPWVQRTIAALDDADCDPILVTLGAAREMAEALVPDRATVVPVDDWEQGLSASLWAGLAAATATSATAVLVVPVDTPGMPASVVRRILEAVTPSTLARATYDGRPGHPVLIGRDHWAAVAASASGDTGAGPYLRSHNATLIECGDLSDGLDIDSR